MQNHFVRSPDQYERQLDFLEYYYHDTATFLSTVTKRPYEECLAYVKKVTAKDGKFALKDPTVFLLNRKENGDREKITLPFSQYMDDIIKRKDIVAPTMTTYLHPKRKKSLISIYIGGNLKKRSKLKKESLAAKMANRMSLHILKENQQNSAKIKNNALSGAHASTGTPLHNKSSHSTLTSVCRCATSYGNTNNEKFLAGNRHYWCADVVLANITNIINNVNIGYLVETMKKFGIRFPTVEETMETIRYSTDLYWFNEEKMKLIERYVKSLSDEQRATFVYAGDMYHLAKYNDSFFRTFFNELLAEAQPLETFEEAEKILSDIDADLTVYISLLNDIDLRDGGNDPKKSLTLRDALEQKSPVYLKVASTARTISLVLDKYQDLIKAFWVVDTAPASIFNVPNSIRRVVVGSDTDSTIFSVQEWAKWYGGTYSFGKNEKAAAATVTYFTSQSIIHILAMLCANCGVPSDQLGMLQMKNEYAFPVFALTPLAKHYYAAMSAREGNIYKELEKEVKGVGLRPSMCPVDVLKRAHQFMMDIMTTIIDGKKLSIEWVLDVVAKEEIKIRESIENGQHKALVKSRINSRSAYKNAEQSAYVQYELWNAVFADKYGIAEEPPYTCVKVALDIKNKTDMKAWLDSMDDVIIRDKLTKWLEEKNKKELKNILLPENNVAVYGIPKEILSKINVRKLIYETVKPYYIVLESLGIFMADDNYSRLVSDYHTPKTK